MSNNTNTVSINITGSTPTINNTIALYIAELLEQIGFTADVDIPVNVDEITAGISTRELNQSDFTDNIQSSIRRATKNTEIFINT